MAVTLLHTPIPATAPGQRHETERSLCSSLLKKALGDNAEIAHRPDGSPFIDSRPDIFISVSHSAGTALIALSDSPVGVDIEAPRPQLARVAGKFLTKEESLRIDSTAPDYLNILLHYWTAKEAAFKLFRLPGLTISEIQIDSELASASSGSKRCRISFTKISEEIVATADCPEEATDTRPTEARN